jgi:hypothetical protein
MSSARQWLRVVAVIADLADVDPILVPPPTLHLISNHEISGFLPHCGRSPVPPVHGTRLRADSGSDDG